MPLITFSGHPYKASSKVSLLESLLTQQAAVPYSCRSGFCHSCLLKAEKGKPPAESQASLDPDKAQQGYFLACQCFPDEDMQVSLASRDKISAIITRKVSLSSTVVALDLAPKYPVSYAPGQYLTLWANNQLARPCYLASVETLDKHLTVHIERKPGGQFSQWAHNGTQVNQKISISDVRGFNICQNLSPNVAIVVQDGCLAPVLALLRKVYSEHGNPQIMLHLQVDQQQNLYAMETIESLTSLQSGFSYQVVSGTDSWDTLGIQLAQLVASQIIVSGQPSFIEQMVKTLSQQSPHDKTLDILPLPYS